MDANSLFGQYWWLILLAAAWGLGWKGWSLWIAARLNQKIWFVVLLLVSTLGILDIAYIFYFSKQTGSQKSSVKK